MFTMFQAAARMWLIGLCEDKPMRGAIEVGTAIALPRADGGAPEDVYGQALLAAHRLESEKAQGPRIVVGPKCGSLLASIVLKKGGVSIDSATSGDAELCIAMTRQDTDGQRIVDGLGRAMLDGIVKPLHSSEHVLRAHDRVRFHYERFRASGNQKLAGRYRALLAYFDEHAPKWYAAAGTPR